MPIVQKALIINYSNLYLPFQPTNHYHDDVAMNPPPGHHACDHQGV